MPLFVEYSSVFDERSGDVKSSGSCTPSMNKTSKVVAIAIAIIIPSVIIGYVALQAAQPNPTLGTASSINSSRGTLSNNANNSILPVSLGLPVTVDNGNETATAIDPHTGRIYEVYYKTANNVTNLYMSHSDDNGKTFSTAVRVNDIVGDAEADDAVPPDIKVAPTGDVYVDWLTENYSSVWTKQFVYGYSTIRVAHSSDGGQTFSKAAHIDTAEYGTWSQYAQGMGVSPDGKTVYIAWINSNGAGNVTNLQDIVMIAKSIDGAQTFGKPVPVDGNNYACSCCKVNVAVDNNGSVYVSWRKLYQSPNSEDTPPNDNDHAYREIVVAKSIDGAQTFSSPVIVYNDKFLYNSCVMSGPQMAFDSKNNLHIVWYTGSNTTGYTPGSYYAVSSDGGKTFSQPIPLSAATQIGVTLEHMTIDSNDNAWIVWEDRTGQNNTMYMYIELPPTKIDIAKITPDGQMTKTILDISNGKLPDITAFGNKVNLSWSTQDHVVKFAPLLPT